MKLAEAYVELGITEGSSKDEAKAAFRQLSKKYHPDVNKDIDAEAKFKKINEAYQIIEDPSKAEREFSKGFDGFNHANVTEQDLNEMFSQHFNNPQGPFGFRVNIGGFNRKPKPVLKSTIVLSFVESVLGIQKKILFKRLEKCGNCKILTDGPKEDCTICSNKGILEVEKEHNIFLPPGILNGNKMRLVDAGDYDLIAKAYSDAIIDINILPDEDMVLDGMDIVSFIELSLLDALKGLSKKVRTIKGEMTLKIKPGCKNMDKLQVKGFGVGNYGSHIFLLKVNYPETSDKLIEFLEKEMDKSNDV